MEVQIGLWGGQAGISYWPLPGSETEIKDFARKCKRIGIDRFFPTIYRPDFVVRFMDFDRASMSELTTFKDFYSPWHPFESLIRYCHAEGVEVHPYLAYTHNGLIWTNWESVSKEKERFPVVGASKFAIEHPEMLRKTRDGKTSFELTGHFVLSPAFSEVREYEISVLKWITQTFNIDGIQLEFLRFRPTQRGKVCVYGYEKPAVEAFEKLYQTSPFDITNDDPVWKRFRASFVIEHLEEIRMTLKAPAKKIELTASLVGIEEQESENNLEYWGEWVEKGLVDGIYLWFREADMDFLRSAVDSAARLSNGQVPIYAEFSCYHEGSFQSPDLLLEAFEVCRQTGKLSGYGFYRADAIEAYNLWEAVEEIARIAKRFP